MGNRTPLVGIKVVEVLRMAEYMFVKYDAKNAIVVALKEMNDAEFVE